MKTPSPNHVSSVDNLPTRFGSGWTSGVLSIVLGIIGLGAVVCFHFPNLFTMPEVRERYPVDLLRAVLHLVLVAAFLHHWHHAIEREAIDKNFAVHFPLLDLLFGTYYLPGKAWPTGYGIHDKVPSGWLPQFFYPFLPQTKSVQENTPTVEVHGVGFIFVGGVRSG